MNFRVALSRVALSTALGFIPALALAQQPSAAPKTRGQCHQAALVKYPNPQTKEHQDAMARCMAGRKV